MRRWKTMRVRGSEVVLRRDAEAIRVEPVAEKESWEDFWNRLVPLRDPVRRWPTSPARTRRTF